MKMWAFCDLVKAGDGLRIDDLNNLFNAVYTCSYDAVPSGEPLLQVGKQEALRKLFANHQVSHCPAPPQSVVRTHCLSLNEVGL